MKMKTRLSFSGSVSERGFSPMHLGRNLFCCLAVLIAAGALLGGRLVEVLFYEWPYYGTHLGHIPAVWLGGMSTHGILIGSVLGTVIPLCLHFLGIDPAVASAPLIASVSDVIGITTLFLFAAFFLG